ncbi:MAG: hypothetical protein J7L82_07200, partial [Staphylothermus sp.]|nr:hypothetical protein [Staphylothermus sp.]
SKILLDNNPYIRNKNLCRRLKDPMYILAIDIGKTKTVATLIDNELKIQNHTVTVPADIILDKEIVMNNLRNAIKKCLVLDRRVLSLDEVDIIVISWAGLDTEADYQLAKKYVEELGLPQNKTHIIHDAMSALYAVTWGNPGVAVIAGTGAIAYGMNKKGETARSSGWGWFVGDEGSSSWIALRALNVASRAYDCRGEKTSLIKRICEFFKVDDLLEIIPVIYQNKLYNNISTIAKLAVIVNEEAEKGDIVSKRILEEAGRELALAAYSVAKQLNMVEEEIIVGGVGSVYNSRIVRTTFKDYLKKYIPNATIKEPLIGHQAVLGSIIYALYTLGYRIEQTLIEKLMDNINKTTI